MNRKHISSFCGIVAVVSLIATTTAFAQNAPVFASLNLERLYASLPGQCISAASNGMVCSELDTDKPLYIRKNKRGEISQIGIRLFPKQYAEAFNSEVLDFIERTALEMLLWKSSVRNTNKLQEYKMTWQYNNVRFGEGMFRSFASSLRAITDSSDFQLKRDSLTYSAIWAHPVYGVTEATFPAQYSVISGKDHKELGDELSEILSIFHRTETGTGNLVEKVTEESLSRLNDSVQVYVKRGKSFILPEINSDTYYLKTAPNAYRLLYNKRYQDATLANLFICADMPNKTLTLDVTHRKYGFTEQKYKVKLSDFIAFFYDRKFETYVGFEPSKFPDIKAVVILYNREFNYINMLLVDAIEDAVFESDSSIKCRMYAYIPSHNINSLFGGSDIQNPNSNEFEPLLFEPN